ncbi:MAG: hypothetical protein FWG50_07530 [Kiritimatiellaeota bacterium]|nr:hypothetical protein [Kiritimatiellota bacterium]
MKTKAVLLLSFAALALLSGCVSKAARQCLSDRELSDAIAKDNVEAVARFLRKVSPDYRLWEGEDYVEVPLITEAAVEEAIGVMELLLMKGADKGQRMTGDQNQRPLERYFLFHDETNANERVVALLRRDRQNTPEEDAVELVEVMLFRGFLLPSTPLHLSVTGLPPPVSTGDLLDALIRKGYPLTRGSRDTVLDAIEIIFQRVDEDTYMVEMARNKDIPLANVFWEGKLEKRYGYWMYTGLGHWHN